MDEEGQPEQEVQLRQLPAQLALVVHGRASTESIKERMGDAFGTLMRHAEAAGVQFAGPPFALYPEPVAGQFAFAVCMPVAPGAVAGEEVEVEELPAIEAATLFYKGPYEAMEPSWRRLNDWVAASGRLPKGALREIYLNDPGEVEKDELLTELVVPLG